MISCHTASVLSRFLLRENLLAKVRTAERGRWSTSHRFSLTLPGLWSLQDAEVVYFASESSDLIPEEHLYLSMPFECRMNIDGVVYPSAERFLLAMQFPSDPALRKEIAALPHEEACARASAETPEDGFDDVKEDVMRQALCAKFMQNAELKLLLRKTDTRLLKCEDDDEYWGGEDNRLGCLLMELRCDLIEMAKMN